MLRNILRQHPNFFCPEETHFYRPSEPFGGPGYRNFILANATLRRHRQIDGISEADFLELVDNADSRAELCERYMRRFGALKKPGARRWFDKTPQNAYGAAMIAMEFRRAKFIHIVRDPLNVVASLRIGKVMKVENLVGACNYWNEAVENLSVLKRAFPARVLELKYEVFTADPQLGVAQIMAFLDEPFEASSFAAVETAEVDHSQAGVLSAEDILRVGEICLEGRARYGYADEAELVRVKAARAEARSRRVAAKPRRSGANKAGKVGKPGKPGKTKAGADGAAEAGVTPADDPT
jgi:hypothetical protein